MRTREERAAYVAEHRDFPPWLLPPAEQRRRHGLEPEQQERERECWLVAPIIFPMIERNSRKELGYCNATEYTLRLWAWIDTGHLYGERSISRRLRQEAARGRLERKVIPPGRPFKNGTWTKRGTTTNRFHDDRERRKRQCIEKRRQRKEAQARARDRMRAKERGERIVKRSEPSPAPRPVDAPRTAIVEVTKPFVMPPELAAFLGDDRSSDVLTGDRLAEHRRKVAEATARARACPELWGDEPPD